MGNILLHTPTPNGHMVNRETRALLLKYFSILVCLSIGNPDRPTLLLPYLAVASLLLAIRKAQCSSVPHRLRLPILPGLKQCTVQPLIEPTPFFLHKDTITVIPGKVPLQDS